MNIAANTLPASAGLATPTPQLFGALYADDETDGNWLPIAHLADHLGVDHPTDPAERYITTADGPIVTGEANLPLGWFLAPGTRSRMLAAAGCPTGDERDYDDTAIRDHIACPVCDYSYTQRGFTDAQTATLPGLTARDIMDARLSRSTLVASLIVLGDMLPDDTRDWSDAWILSDTFPYSARVWDPQDLADRARFAAFDVARRLHAGDPYPARSTADEMLLWSALRLYGDTLSETDLYANVDDLIDELLEDEDFLFLFDRRYDGIEDSPLAEQMGMTLTGPRDWFRQFRPDHQPA